MAGETGAKLSEGFGRCSCDIFGMSGWEEFHQTWIAVRTKYIDEKIFDLAGNVDFKQIVNLGAGYDTRPYRLPCYESFSNGNFNVDVAAVNAEKQQVLEKLLDGTDHAEAWCKSSDVDLDFLDESTSLKEQLATTAFDPAAPAIILCEGLVSFLGDGKVKFLEDLSAIAAPGSALILSFNDFSECPAHDHFKNYLSREKATEELAGLGWTDLRFSKFGDDSLNFGRFPTDRFSPKAAFSFVVATKTAGDDGISDVSSTAGSGSRV